MQPPTAALDRNRSVSAAAAAALLFALAGASCGGEDPSSPTGSANGPANGAEPTQERPRGAWYSAPAEAMDAEQSARAGALEGIGYASGMESAAGRSSGVGYLAEALVEPGLNFYSSGHGAEAHLIDANGEVLHRWSRPIPEIWPDGDFKFGYFRKARLLDDGVILVVFEGHGLAALDRDSNVLWTYDEPAHHDVQQLEDGTFVVLDRDAKVFPALHPDRPLLDDGIAFLGADGTPLGRVSLLQSLLKSERAEEVRELIDARIAKGLELEEQTKLANAEKLKANPELLKHVDYVGDCLHSNSVRRVGAEFAANCDALKEGWYLVSIRELHLLAAIEVSPDLSEGIARWIMRGEWRKQHEAVPLPSGAIMLFDNHGGKPRNGRGSSRVLDIDPATGAIQRAIDGVDRVRFASNVGGSCQRLANGNTLVIESTKGSAYEVTPDDRLAWAFHNPHRAGEDEELIAFLPDLHRVPASHVESWLSIPSAGSTLDPPADSRR